jgi:hypothetical protein
MLKVKMDICTTLKHRIVVWMSVSSYGSRDLFLNIIFLLCLLISVCIYCHNKHNFYNTIHLVVICYHFGHFWPSSGRFCNNIHRKEYEVEASPSQLIHLNT